jgi:hypothetical protein
VACFFIYIIVQSWVRVWSWRNGRAPASEGGRNKGKLQRHANCVDTCGVLVRIISVLRDLEGVWLASD